MMGEMKCGLEREGAWPAARFEALAAPAKMRRVTYWSRKAETCQLRQEVNALGVQLAVLKNRQVAAAAVTADSDRVGPELCKTLTDQHVLGEAARRQQLQVAAGQAMLSQFSGDLPTHPLYTRISLSKDWEERRAALIGMRMQKLHNGYQYTMARCGSLDQLAMRSSDNRFETDLGDLGCDACDIHTFEGVKSLQQVYDAVLFSVANLEINISERLGHITVRDEYLEEEGVVYNARMITTNEHGVTTESSTAIFTHLFADGDPAFGGEPCAVMAANCVEEDELYPYLSMERVRRDSAAATVFTVSKHNPTTSEAGGKIDGEESSLVDVTMRRTGFMKLYRPEFPISDTALQEVQDGMTRWSTIMVKTIREMVYSQT